MGYALNAEAVRKQKEKAQGDAVVHIYSSSLGEIEVYYQIKQEQKIAEALSDADTLINSLKKQIEKDRRIKTALMRHHFFDPNKQNGRYCPLGEYAKIYQSETISSSDMTSFGFPVYGANGQIGFYHNYNHEDWQITITCRGSTCGTVGRTVPRSWITGNAMVINTDEQDCIYKPYLYHYLSSLDFSDLITGTGQPQIVRGPLKNIQIMLPSLEEQKFIASQLEDLDKLHLLRNEQYNKAKKIKAGMMQELLTGRMRLHEPPFRT